ncbi:F-box protein At2g05970-like [Telopea speciosissima]|uniref:F-box protein At2g05970-like n=1 Tax=Telopea speciosissima TaxID=54955 RepID=UPI001CC50D3F|nr:F-box protein At2g05970-like [Telopea speciosissima]
MEVERVNLRKKRKCDWSSLHKDLFDLITEKLCPADLIQASCVCSSWRSISPPFHLWLVLPCHNIITIEDDSDDNEIGIDGESNSTSDPEKTLGFVGFVSLSHPNRKVHKLQIPEAKGCEILGSSAGWLVTLRANGAIRLLHPFSRATIQLPPLKLAKFMGSMFKISKTSIEKVIVCSGPDGESLIMCKYAGKLAFYRPGKDLNWVGFKQFRGVIEDMVAYKGRIYGLRISRNKCHLCVACGLDDPSPTMEELVEIPKHSGYIQYYLVESSGHLLLVLRHRNWPIDCDTNGFTVFRLDIGGMVEFKDLGDQALFLDCNSAFSASASDFPAIKGNQIYLTNTCFPDEKLAGHCDMEVFNLEDETFESFDHCDDPDLITQAPVVFPTNSCWRGGLGFRMV